MPANDGAHRFSDRLSKSGLDGADAQRVYRYMLLARAISEKSWLLTRQGRVLFSTVSYTHLTLPTILLV